MKVTNLMICPYVSAVDLLIDCFSLQLMFDRGEFRELLTFFPRKFIFNFAETLRRPLFDSFTHTIKPEGDTIGSRIIDKSHGKTGTRQFDEV